MKSRASMSSRKAKAKLPTRRTRAGSRFAALRGACQTGRSTDKIMNQLRGYDDDARDPGFKPAKK